MVGCHASDSSSWVLSTRFVIAVMIAVMILIKRLIASNGVTSTQPCRIRQGERTATTCDRIKPGLAESRFCWLQLVTFQAWKRYSWFVLTKNIRAMIYATTGPLFKAFRLGVSSRMEHEGGCWGKKPSLGRTRAGNGMLTVNFNMPPHLDKKTNLK